MTLKDVTNTLTKQHAPRNTYLLKYPTKRAALENLAAYTKNGKLLDQAHQCWFDAIQRKAGYYVLIRTDKTPADCEDYMLTRNTINRTWAV